MFIKCTLLLEGPGPDEAIVGIRTMRGVEEVVVDTGLIQDARLNVGPIVIRQSDQVLIELPRESASGRSRVWIPNSEIALEPEAV